MKWSSPIPPDQLIKGMQEKCRLLSQKNDELKDLSEIMAQKKRDYAVKLSLMMIAMKEEGKPATLIPDLAKGDKDVAQARYEKDVSIGVYEACKQSIRDIITAIDSYRSILSYEKEERFNQNT